MFSIYDILEAHFKSAGHFLDAINPGPTTRDNISHQPVPSAPAGKILSQEVNSYPKPIRFLKRQPLHTSPKTSLYI